jgi:Protein of unknown function (DUF742)
MSDLPHQPDPLAFPGWNQQGWFAPGADGSLVQGGSTAAWTPPAPSDDRSDQLAGRSDDDTFLRPFILTEGRTQPLQDGLRIETQVVATPAALSAPLRYERRRIVELCQRSLSVAEVASGLGVPLGVARVLVADLATENLVTVREPAELPFHVIERIRDLVREL